jgi:hypothetical protein
MRRPRTGREQAPALSVETAEKEKSPFKESLNRPVEDQRWARRQGRGHKRSHRLAAGGRDFLPAGSSSLHRPSFPRRPVQRFSMAGGAIQNQPLNLK